MTFREGEKVIWLSGSLANPINKRASFVRYSKTKIKAEIRIESTDEVKMVLVENLGKVLEVSYEFH
jgi:hypothetical protein